MKNQLWLGGSGLCRLCAHSASLLRPVTVCVWNVFSYSGWSRACSLLSGLTLLHWAQQRWQLSPVLVTTSSPSPQWVILPYSHSKSSGYCVYRVTFQLGAILRIAINPYKFWLFLRTLTSLLPPDLYDMTATWNEIYFHRFCSIEANKILSYTSLKYFFPIRTPMDVRTLSPWTYIDTFDLTWGFVAIFSFWPVAPYVKNGQSSSVRFGLLLSLNHTYHSHFSPPERMTINSMYSRISRSSTFLLQVI